MIEYLILADAVQVVDGKLHMTGGGWDTLFVGDLSSVVRLPVAFGVEIPWADADKEHTLTVTVAAAGGADIAPPYTQPFRTGRPPGLSKGASVHFPVAITWELTFPSHGAYVVRAQLDGRRETVRTRGFTVRTPPGSGPAISEEELNVIDEELGLIP